MKIVEFREKIDGLRKDMEYLERMLATKACRTCMSFERGVCKVANMTPPDHVQPVGCDEWDWDECPF